MKASRQLRLVTVAGSCALGLAAAVPVSAQPSDSKRPPEGASAKSAADQGKSGVRDVSEHEGLTRATQSAIDHAQTLEDQARDPETQLTKATLIRHTAAIGQALETARQHLSSIESEVPADDGKRNEICEEMREKYDSAAEHYRALLEQTNRNKIDEGEVQDHASDLVDDLREALAEHRKLPGRSAVKAPPMPDRE
jgi:hypothetical protein